MGIGRRLVAPWAEGLPWWPVYLGTVLPDLIDKPLYHLGVFITGRQGQALGLISGTRTFGHTTVLVLLVALFAAWRGSAIAKALALGMASHLVLDTIGDFFNQFAPHLPYRNGPTGGIEAVLWPLLGWHFPTARMPTFSTYVGASFSYVNVIAEVIGAALLVADWRLRRRRVDAAR